MVRNALREAGLPSEGFGRFGRLVQPQIDYEHSVPILLDLLGKVSNERVKEALVRSLTTKYAKPVAAETLLREFETTPPRAGGLKWAIGNALNVVCDRSHRDELIRLARRKEHGGARQMIVLRLGSMRDPDVQQTLTDLIWDPDVASHAMSALRQQLGPLAALPLVRRVAEEASGSVQEQAQRELKKIQKALIRPKSSAKG